MSPPLRGMGEECPNRGGDSGITGYEITDDSITVHFGDGSAYLYTYTSAGHANIDRMKALAQAGKVDPIL
jgi:hypothetical protein